MSRLLRETWAQPGRGPLRRALAAYALFGVVELAIWVAVILIAYDRGGARLAATASVVQLVPAVVLGPPLAAVGSRLSRGTALATAHAAVAVTTGATAGAILLTAPTSVIVGASATATTVLAVVRPLHFAALPRLARGPDQLVSANATSSMSDAFALFAGPVIAGLVTATAGPWLVVVGSTAASAVATLLCLRLRLGAPPSRSEESVGAVPAPRSRLAMTRDPGSLTLVLVMSTGFLIGGALDVLAVAYSENVLGRGEAGAGLLVGSIGIGAFVGAMIAGRLSHGRRLAPIVVLGGVVQGLAVALVAGVGSTSAAVAAIALTGAGGAFLSVAGRTLLQRAMDDALLARVFAFLESASLLGFAAGAAVAPTLITMFSAAGAFVPLGLTVAVVTTVVALPILRLDLRVAVALDPRPTSEDVAVSGTATSPGPLAR